MAHVWEKSYPQGVSWDTPLPPAVPLESLLETAATKWPDRTAIDFYDRTFTFRELHDLAARAAKGLQALGVGPGVHVGLHLPNTPHFVIAFFAVLMAGGWSISVRSAARMIDRPDRPSSIMRCRSGKARWRTKRKHTCSDRATNSAYWQCHRYGSGGERLDLHGVAKFS